MSIFKEFEVDALTKGGSHEKRSIRQHTKLFSKAIRSHGQAHSPY